MSRLLVPLGLLFALALMDTPPVIAQEAAAPPSPVAATPRSYRFDGKMSWEVLGNYLSRSLSMEGILITWFAHQPQEYRKNWLRYAWDWVQKTDPNGRLQMPGSCTMRSPLDGKRWYYANQPVPTVPEGLNDEEVIRTIWREDGSASSQQKAMREHRVRTADEFRRAVQEAKPGDRILLAPGDYQGAFFFSNVRGEAGKPIVIAGADPQHPPRIRGDSECLHISSAAWLELRSLLLTDANGNGLNIDDGGKADTPSHDITLSRVQVKNIGPEGNRDGIKLSGVDRFTLSECAVERWGSDGSGIDMVGCHQGVIKDCTFRLGGSNAVQMKGGTSEMRVTHCLFENCGERCVNIGGGTAPETFQFNKNFWYCLDRPARSQPKLPTPEEDGVYGRDPLFQDVAHNDFRLKPNSPAQGYGAESR